MRKSFQIKEVTQTSDISLCKINTLQTQLNEISPNISNQFNRMLVGEKNQYPSQYENTHSQIFKHMIQSIKNGGYAKEEHQKFSYVKNLRRFKNGHYPKTKYKQEQKNRKTLERIISKQKVNNIVKIFIDKLKHRVSRPKNTIFELRQQNLQRSILDKNGLSLNLSLQIISTFISLLSFILLMVLLSEEIIFMIPPFQREQIVFKCLIFVLLFLLIVWNFVVVRKLQGKTVYKIREIIKLYLQEDFIIDSAILLIVLADIFMDIFVMKYIRFIFLIKFRNFQKDMARIDYIFINNFYKEQYWRMFRLLGSIFFVAHFIALILLVMTDFSPQSNWLTKARLDFHGDFEKYIWAYYWSITTMLSVGFGDLTPQNYKQALCLIFIQSISSIFLAYTINCVGELMLSIRGKQLEKKRNLKILKQIVEQNQVSRPVQQKVGNYIEQTIQIKKKVNYQEHQNFIYNLPHDVKSDLLVQCNLKLFNSIPLIKNFTSKIIRELAVKIELSISHPEEILLHNESPWCINILKQGQIGYFTCPSKFNTQYLMNQLKISSKQTSQIISLNFIPKNRINYLIKSITYSQIYSISEEEFIGIIRKSQTDAEEFYKERDKAKIILDEYENIICDVCLDKKHTKATCPKLHFIPYRNMIYYKYLEKSKRQKNRRILFEREKKSNWEVINNEQQSIGHYKINDPNNVCLQKDHPYRIYPQIKRNPLSNNLEQISLDIYNSSYDGGYDEDEVQKTAKNIDFKNNNAQEKNKKSNFSSTDKFQIKEQENPYNNEVTRKLSNFYPQISQKRNLKTILKTALSNGNAISKEKTRKNTNIQLMNKYVSYEQSQNEELFCQYACPYVNPYINSYLQNPINTLSTKNINSKQNMKGNEFGARKSTKIVQFQYNYPYMEQNPQFYPYKGHRNQLRTRSYILSIDFEERFGIQSDKIYDFKYYFPQHNAKYMKNKLLNGKSMKKRTKKADLTDLSFIQ